MTAVPNPKEAKRPSIASIPESRRRTALWSYIEKKWSHIQVGHQGSYSIERLELLHEYSQTTSFTRVFLVCLLTPVPAVLAAVLLECLPLTSPSEGWEANWMFWIRHVLVTFVIFGVGSWQIDLYVPGHNVSLCQQLSLTVAVSVVQLGTYIAEAAIVGFPIPFMWQFGVFTIGIYIPLLTRLIYGPAFSTKGSILHQRHKDFQDTVLINLIVTGVFPFCKGLYDLLPPAYRGVVVLVLPIWKFGAKIFAVRMSRQVEDFMPELVAFSVDFFGSLFISVCLSTSGAFYLTTLVIVIDIVNLMHKFHGLSSEESIVLQTIQARRHNEFSVTKSDRLSDKSDSVELVTMIVETVRDPSVTSLKHVRLWASPPHLISQQTYINLKELEASGKFGSNPQPATERTTFVGEPRWMFRTTRIVPDTCTSMHGTVRKRASAGDKSLRGDSHSGQFVRRGLQLLFHCEYFMLVEYIECIVPFVYVIYKSVLQQLPNVEYYPCSAGKWDTRAVTNLVVFAILEVGSLVLIELFLRHKFAFSPLRQLAFVLERQFLTVQASLFSLMLFTLEYQLVHLGVDFTFRFDWLRQK